jgi:predicted acyl esterase
MGKYRVSDRTPFEAPDPAYWVPHGYVVVHVDRRGCFKSQGERKVFSRAEINDYGHIIDWAGTQSFQAGESLRLVISGADIFSHAMLHHRERCNQGQHTLHCGADYDAGLLVPFVLLPA